MTCFQLGNFLQFGKCNPCGIPIMISPSIVHVMVDTFNQILTPDNKYFLNDIQINIRADECIRSCPYQTISCQYVIGINNNLSGHQVEQLRNFLINNIEQSLKYQCDHINNILLQSNLNYTCDNINEILINVINDTLSATFVNYMITKTFNSQTNTLTLNRFIDCNNTLSNNTDFLNGIINDQNIIIRILIINLLNDIIKKIVTNQWISQSIQHYLFGMDRFQGIGPKSSSNLFMIIIIVSVIVILFLIALIIWIYSNYKYIYLLNSIKN